ncbi:hypothetical protein [Methylomagnum ishizawai]|uniref:hypothetical protein n=1 Tax=Methylomagnum ishizawai TaxID=1760988 RepID=UPI001C324211|nr:hypothetical protein [Methylomagnum ishizawai]BBL74197.1 hypothetical protein MishRS11D_12950 [Methylomagnum ishizawai]
MPNLIISDTRTHQVAGIPAIFAKQGKMGRVGMSAKALVISNRRTYAVYKVLNTPKGGNATRQLGFFCARNLPKFPVMVAVFPVRKAGSMSFACVQPPQPPFGAFQLNGNKGGSHA